MGAEFSKKMCKELLLYEDYLMCCPPAKFHKDKILVEREPLVQLISDLRTFHCANRQIATVGDEEDVVVTETIAAAEDSNVAQTSVTCEQMLEKARQQAEAIILQANVEAERLKAQAQSLLSSAETESETARVKVQEAEQQVALMMENAKTEYQTTIDAMRKQGQTEADALVNEGRVKADLMITRAKGDIEKLNSENEEKQREQFKTAADEAKIQIEEQSQAALEVLKKTIQQSEEMLALVTGFYDQQMNVIHQDRQEIINIIAQLEEQWQ